MIFRNMVRGFLICVRNLYGQRILVRMGAGVINESSFSTVSIL
jgi:hypothetical protein